MISTVIDASRRVGLGQIEIAHAPAQLTAILGSCVGVAIHDRKTSTGTLVHVVMPHGDDQDRIVAHHAERAVNDSVALLEEAGCDRENLIAKIAGGAKMFGAKELTARDENNIAAVRHALNAANIELRGEHVGGSKGRRVTLFAQTGGFLIEMPSEDPLTL